MIYVSLSYNYSPSFNSPETWFKRTEGYIGVLECLSKKNTVINVNQINYHGYSFFNGVYHRFVKFRQQKYFPLRLNNFVKSLNSDVVLVHGLHQPLQLIQLRLLLNKNTKIIAQHHAEVPFTGIKKVVQRIADRYVNAYLFASAELGLDWVQKGNIGNAKKIHQVMEVSSLFYPVNKNEAKLKTGINGESIFLWVGRLNANKDPLNVVKAFLRFTLIQPSAKLYMIYHTDELLADIKELLNAHPNGNSVELVGQVPHDDLLYWFNSADFLLSGSHYEGSGTAVCEAMSCGCVPIVTDIFSFRMITDNGKCGILYEAGNENALLNALKQSQVFDILEKRKLSLEYFNSNLSFEAIAEQIQEIANSL